MQGVWFVVVFVVFSVVVVVMMFCLSVIPIKGKYHIKDGGVPQWRKSCKLHITVEMLNSFLELEMNYYIRDIREKTDNESADKVILEFYFVEIVYYTIPSLSHQSGGLGHNKVMRFSELKEMMMNIKVDFSLQGVLLVD